MTKKDIISTLENKLDTKIITYITVDRINGPGASIATDVIDLFPRHLDDIGEVDNISLFLYSSGGDVHTTWRLVNLVREYCSKLRIIVPYKARSAATLICLGADEILMGKMSELSPIDPSVSNAFNPDDPRNPSNKIQISVEDVTSFIKLVKNELGEDAVSNNTELICNIFKQLTDKIHPLALGNVQRSHIQIREIAKKLLGLHMNPDDSDDKEKITRLVNILTEELYSHKHLIPRYEAKNIIGLKVKYFSKEEEKLVKDLYNIYKEDLDIGKTFNPIDILGDNEQIDMDLKIALIETLQTTDTFFIRGNINRSDKPLGKPSVNIKRQSWEKVI